METNKYRPDEVTLEIEYHDRRMKTLRVYEETDPEQLRTMAKSPDYSIRVLVAKNPNTPDDLLAALVESSNKLVGEAAKNTTIRLRGKMGGGSKPNLSGIGRND